MSVNGSMEGHGPGLLLGALLLAAAGAAGAQEDRIQIFGFVSQGYFKTTDNNYLMQKSTEGSFQFTEAALNVSARPIPNLRVGVQVYARDFGQEGNQRLVLDWALGDYRYRDWLGVRVGKVKLPRGFYNELQDADMTRPEILQPTSIYPIARRDIQNAFSGAGLYGSFATGAKSSLEYDLFGGTMDIDDRFVIRQYMQSLALGAAPALAAAGIPNASTTTSDVTGRVPRTYGVNLRWNTPIQGLRVGATLTSTQAEFRARATYAGYAGSLPLSIGVDLGADYDEISNLVLSGEYQRGGLRLNAEYAEIRADLKPFVTGLPGRPQPAVTMPSNSRGWYAQAVYRVNEKFQASVYHDVSYTSKDDPDGERYIGTSTPKHAAWNKDTALTLRFDLTSNWLLKVEGHRVDGSANPTPVENPDGLSANWNILVVKTTFHF